MVWHPAHSRLFKDVGILSSSNKHKPPELCGAGRGKVKPPGSWFLRLFSVLSHPPQTFHFIGVFIFVS